MRFIRFQTLNFSVGVLIKSIFKRVSTHEPSKIISFLPHLSAIGSCCWRVMCYTYVELTHWTESETSSDRKIEEQPRRQTKRWKKDGGTDGEADRWINRQIKKHTHRRAVDWSDLYTYGLTETCWKGWRENRHTKIWNGKTEWQKD